MAKRFIDTDTFRKPLLRGLEGAYKLLWLYLICECDHAGIWEVELDVANLRLGEDFKPSDVIERFNGAIVPIEGGAKWHIPSFIAFQYGELNESNRVHKSVLTRLRRFGLVKALPVEASAEPLFSREAQAEAVEAADIEALPARPTEPPFKDIVEGFNSVLGDCLTPISIPTYKRKEAMRLMWEFFKQDIEKINAYWQTVRKSKFLTGRVGGKSFKATFDWLMKEDNAAKVVEGQYRNEGRAR